MREKEEAIKGLAFIIHADMKYGIKPAANAASVRWLKLALAWAVAHRRRELEKTIMEYLADETESRPVVALAMNAVQGA